MFEKHEYTIDDFTFDNFYKIKSASGQWSNYSNKYDINYSSILTDLIQNTGRFCEHYASDLFIDWNVIENYLSEKHNAGEKVTFLFGLRENGVDHKSYVIHNYNNNNSKEYRKLFILTIEIEEDDYITMKYGKCNVKYYPNF